MQTLLRVFTENYSNGKVEVIVGQQDKQQFVEKYRYRVKT